MIAKIVLLIYIAIIIIMIIDTKNSFSWRDREYICSKKYTPKSGDIILFNTKSFQPKPTTALFIKLFTNSDISHIGIIWVDPKTNIPWLWHTGPVHKELNVIPRIDGVSHYAHLVPFKEVVEYEKNSRIIVRKLNKPLCPEKMGIFVNKNLGANYAFDLVLSWYKKNLDSIPLDFLPERGSNYWSCGELVQQTLVYMGILDHAVESYNYFPSDFTIKKDDLWMKNDFKYGKEFVILK